jgi:PAS domain S-box-containing protein
MERFFGDLGMQPDLLKLFDFLPDVHFFVKDADGNMMAMNQQFAERLGAHDQSEVIGKSTEETSPPELAQEYREDDRAVMKSGRPMVDRVELNQASDGSVNWFVTCKVPLRRRDGTVAGVAGIARDVEKARATLRPFDEFEGVIEHIREHHRQQIRIPDLAEMMHMSVSSFERRFKRLFGMSPLQYITRYRVNRVCHELMVSRKTTAAIAEDVGFYDESSLSRHFVKCMGITPREYRRINSPRTIAES